MNEITLTGNIGKEPELLYSEHTGDAVLRFSIAQNDRYFDRRSGEWRENPPVWTEVVAFRELAENTAEALHAGDAVIVIGKLADNSFTPPGPTTRSGAPSCGPRASARICVARGPA